ncbi:hypothetical protein ABL78_3729 [Leptomonas seymouri]|uniref:Uncharacterized protein n=1 Tax=Leptomonas seymouri TaxID=5684 RepID=A0A0N1IL63_LEPSE|nr:hypothetical protein ABL78_3729 [Leptomonas seymouri]|eukprot:KPI87213.1 hypothetical protein ABL78_3729 [Leptomonas seymouri]
MMASCVFKSFTREWGSLLARDASTSLDHLFETYRRADASDRRAATIEDYTELWMAAKRANIEWEATCMARSVRQSVALDGAVTAFHLMTSMMCWAATLHQRTADFFKECKAQVRDIVARAVARCSALAGEEEASAVYQGIAFCVTLELFGWHDSLLMCLRAVTAQQACLSDEQDVLLFIATVAQYLKPKYAPPCFGAESMPSLTTGRTSTLSSSSEQDTMPNHNTTNTVSKEEVAVVMGDLPSPSQRCAVSEDASSLRVKLEPTRAVGAAQVGGGGVGGVTAVQGCTSFCASATGPPRCSSTALNPPTSPTLGSSNNCPQYLSRSRGTPQPSLWNATTPTHDLAPSCTRGSITTTACPQDRPRKDKIRERRWPVALKKGKATAKQDNHGCAVL